MKKWILALAVVGAAAVPAATWTAFAGDCGGGFQCDNVCPLAKEANEHRSAGREALTTAPALRAALAATVERNLARI
jgi:hypothetical protein